MALIADDPPHSCQMPPHGLSESESWIVAAS